MTPRFVVHLKNGDLVRCEGFAVIHGGVLELYCGEDWTMSMLLAPGEWLTVKRIAPAEGAP